MHSIERSDQKFLTRIKIFASKTAAVAFCLLVLASFALAGSADATAASAGDPDGYALDRGSSELGFWGGYSPDNPTAIGITTNRPFGELNLQYARVLVARDNWALKWTIELVPVAVISQPRQVNVVQGNFVVSVDAPGTHRAIYGAGASPIGLQLNFRRHRMLQPYINGTAGVLYFTDQVPVSGSSQFNFAVGWGGGVQIWYRENRSVSLGYKFHHISNANSATRNPGVDSNLFYAGYSWSWHPRH
jgi:opacity protein-like surface antigen